MKFRTEISIPKGGFEIRPTDRLLFVGSCFADNIGAMFRENQFRTVVNPYGVMYNPASILHTVERESLKWTEGSADVPDVAVFTLGTNHVYILDGEIVDNCRKRPANLFTERELSISECADYLHKAVEILHSHNPEAKIIFTVSPIRYAKYGYHESQLSKATLLLAVQSLLNADTNHDECSTPGRRTYFPAYEIMNDELRDYRFYKPDMLHPSEQAVEFIYDRFAATYFSATTHQFLKEWAPIKAALAHRPFNPEGEEYQRFIAKARNDAEQFRKKWGYSTSEFK